MKRNLITRLYAAIARRVHAPVRSLYLKNRVHIMRNALARPNIRKPHGLANQVIISLTSYPPRFGKLHLTLQSLLLQDTCADRVIVWIAEHDMRELPKAVTDLTAYGLEIRACADMGSYKKIVPCVQEFPDCFIVTADDDIYYPPNWLGALCKMHKDDDNDKNIIAHRAHRITFKPDGMPQLYNEWKHKVKGPAYGADLFATSGGGVLYPPRCFAADMTNESLFERVCPRADDIWLYWMIRLNGYRYCVTDFGSEVLNWDGTQDTSLLWENVAAGGNDEKIARMIKEYGFPKD